MSRRDDTLWLLALLWLLTRSRKVASDVSVSVTKTSALAPGESATASSEPASHPE